jgi:calcium-translocating P-type ATPase
MAVNTPGISKEELRKLVEAWRARQGPADEVQIIQDAGGNAWLESGLATCFENGLKKSEIEQRRLDYGSNYKDVEEPPSFWELFVGALNDFTLIILIVCAFVSMAINLTFHEDKSIAWIEGAAILMAVAISSIIGAYNDYEKEKKFISLSESAENGKSCTIIRDGQKSISGLGECVVGDVIEMVAGMEIPADGFLIQGYNVESDESAFTGESEAVRKEGLSECLVAVQESDAADNAVPSPILLAGSRITNGVGKFVVLNVGENCAIGQVRKQVEEDVEEGDVTPLQMKLETIARDIGQFGLISAIFTVVFMLIRFGIDLSRSTQGWDTEKHPGEIVGYFIIGITIIVVAIPEGLPLAVTLSLAYSVQKMLHDNNLVRKLAACETMGGAQEICTDKTGT